MPVPLSWVPIVAKTTWARFEDDREKEAESSEEEAASLVQEAAGSLGEGELHAIIMLQGLGRVRRAAGSSC